MCLFKRDEQENNCVHDECKNYYMLNKQICMYSKQSQEPKQQKPSEDHNLLDLLQKKIKKETDLKSTSQESSSQFSQQPVYSQTYVVNSNAYVPQKMQFPVKTEAPTTTVYYPVMSQPQTMQQQNMHAVPMESNPIPQNFNTMSLNQLIAMRNQNSMESQIPQAMTQIPTTMAQMTPTMSQMPTTTMRPVENVSVTQAFENSMKDFQNKLLNLVLSQNKIMVELKEKNDLIQDTLSCLVSEVSVLKKSIKPSILENPSIPSVNPAMIPKMMGSANDTINTDSLLTYLYGPSTDFQYQLVLKQELSLPLYRERNFRFTVMLVDKAGKLIENTNRIPLTIGIYSSENPPKYIDTNTSGNKILKGFIEKDLKNGTVSFDKIQIKEVTSHFRNGWIFFVVHPKLSNTTLAGEGNPTFVSGHKIRPLVLEKVVVKAKKAKEKNTNVESEENVQEDVEAEAETEQPEKDESAYATSTD